MKHPTSESIYRVIENFKKVLPLATREDHLDMMEGVVCNNLHKCGTIHCHAGWYIISKIGIIKNNKSNIDYNYGAEAMAKDMGFVNSEMLKDFFVKYNKLWGNENAEEMFTGGMAFYHHKKRLEGAINLQHIIDHWTEVAERVKALEAQQTRTDITKSLAVIPVDEKLDATIQ